MKSAPDQQKVDQQIADNLAVVKAVLGRDLLGMYLYGSSVFGGLGWSSDIDLFVVSARPTSRDDKIRLGTEMLAISSPGDPSRGRPIELTIVVQAEINPWRYPPAFDFQYGDWLRAEFTAGDVEPWGTTVRPDLALLITQVLLASETLHGQEPHELLDPVPYRDFIAASVDELDNLLAELESDTRNVLLTLARIWSTLDTDALRSKPDAAAWVIERLPAEDRPVMHRAREICLGHEPDRWDDLGERIPACAAVMVSRITTRAAMLRSSPADSRAISLAPG